MNGVICNDAFGKKRKESSIYAATMRCANFVLSLSLFFPPDFTIVRSYCIFTRLHDGGIKVNREPHVRNSSMD